jgi:hypothetical protein
MHEAYHAMAEEVLRGTVTPIDPTTAQVTEMLIQRGVEIVITSNSGTERILDIFKKNDILATSHPETKEATPRVRGAARKFELAENSDGLRVIEFGGRRVETSRPDYERIMREERPQAVMGDVFSFDLATPLALARNEPALFPQGLKLILRRRDYTPRWVLDGFAAACEKNVQFFVLENLEDLPKMLVG